MAKTKTDRRRSAAPAPRRTRSAAPAIDEPAADPTPPRAKARRKPTPEQRAKLDARRQRLKLAELTQAGRETSEAIGGGESGGPLLRGPCIDPQAEQLAALRAVDEIGRRADPLHCWAPFDEVADRLAEELAARWRRELAAALAGDADELTAGEYVERHRPDLRQRARVQLHELAELPSATSPEGRLAVVQRQRPASWIGDEPPAGLLVVRLTREGREAAERLEAAASPPRFEGADDRQLVLACTYLAELPLGARVKPAELRERLTERWPSVTFTRDTIGEALRRGKRIGYLEFPERADRRRTGATLTASGRRFVDLCTAR